MFKDLIQRSFLALLVFAPALYGVMALPVHAETGPWNWTDNSSQISIRTNRPVWAVAFANGSWFYTDGQDLTTTGHVWKSDGKTSKDISADIRNVGMWRVDDIVSDGKTVLFLNNVAPRNNSIEVIAFDGSYKNLTASFRKALASGEGIVQLAGNSGKWALTTSKGRVLVYTPSTDTFKQAADFGVELIPYLAGNPKSVGYVQNHVSNRTLAIGILPLKDGWLLSREAPWLNGPNMHFKARFAFVDQDAFAIELDTKGLVMDYVTSLASNGDSALIAGIGNSQPFGPHGNPPVIVFTFDGKTFTEISSTFISSQQKPIFPEYLGHAQIAWTGTSWMILNGKDVYRLNGDQLESYGQTRDYFTSMASDNAGHVMLGGAASTNDAGYTPSFPLAAKLVSVTETNATTQTSLASTNGTSFWTWIEPTLTTLHRDETASYNVGAWNANGIKKMEIFVNWTLVKTCDLGSGALGNQNCSVKLIGSNYAADSTVSMIAKITNEDDTVTWTTFTSLLVKEPVLALAMNTYPVSTNSGISTYTWLEPNLSSLNPNGTTTLKSQANSNDGLNRIELVVDGKTKKICDFARAYGTQDCEVTLSGLDFTLGSKIPVYAKATGAYGSLTTSAVRTIEIRDNLKNAGSNPSVMLTWLSPVADTIQKGQEGMAFVQAKDTDGLDHIDILVNGTTAKSCATANAYDTRECSTPISAALYPNASTVDVTGRAVDNKGNITLTDTRNYTIQK